MISRTPLKTSLLSFFALCACSFSTGQSSVHYLKEGAWIPVYEVRGSVPYCVYGDNLVKGDKDGLTMLSSESFGPGFLRVEVLENKRAGVVKSGQEFHFVTQSGWFEFAARVTSDVDLDNVYCVMRFDQFGEASYLCRRVGDLKAGKSRVVSIFTRLKYEMPEQIHFYSGTEEIRTNLVPESYSYEFGRFLLASK